MQENAIKPSEAELDLGEFSSQGFSDSQQESFAQSSQPSEVKAPVGEDQELAEEPPKKSSSTKMILIGLGIVVVVMGGLLGLTAMSVNSSKPAAATKLDFGSGTKTVPDKAATGSQVTGVSLQEFKQLQTQVSQLIESIETIKNGVDSSNEMINKKFKQQDGYFVEIKSKMESQDKVISALDTTGSSKFVDQEKRIDELEKKLLKRVDAEFNKIRKLMAAEKKAREESKRANYEVVSVIKDRIRLKDIDSRNEVTKSKGDVLDGYGRIQSIDIYGCIKFENGALYSPINARCVK